MVKIVYNNRYGSFSLSREAVLRAREISGDPNWGGPCIAGDIYEDGKFLDTDYGYINLPRTDPILVQVVEELGAAANGHSAELAIAELAPGTRYFIDGYEGVESVVTEEDIDWQIAEEPAPTHIPDPDGKGGTFIQPAKPFIGDKTS